MATETHYVLVVYMFINKVKFSSLHQCNLYMYIYIFMNSDCNSVYFHQCILWIYIKVSLSNILPIQFSTSWGVGQPPGSVRFLGHPGTWWCLCLGDGEMFEWLGLVSSQEKWWFHVDLTRLNGIDLCCFVVPCFAYSVRHGHLQKIEKTHGNRFKTESQCQVVPR